MLGQNIDGFPIPNGDRSDWDFLSGVTLVVDKGWFFPRQHQHCAITFSIGPFKHTIDCDISSLDFSNLILDFPYEKQCKSLNDAQKNTHTLFKDNCIYKITIANNSSPHPGMVQQLILHKCLSLHDFPNPTPRHLGSPQLLYVHHHHTTFTSMP